MRLSFLVFLALLLVLPASAKNDAYVEDLLSDWAGIDSPLALPFPLEWKAIHGRLGVYGDVDAFSFHFEKAFEDWSVEVRVPVCGAHFLPVYPNVAIIGAGLETPEDMTLPFTLPEGQGALILTQSERLEPRAQDTEFSFVYETPDSRILNVYYEESSIAVDIPQVGDYTLAIWEPDGHVGAYFLWLGNEHPSDFSYRNMDELEEALNMINTGRWIGQDCEAPMNAEACPPALEPVGDFPSLNFPERSELAEGLALVGTIYDAVTCSPLAGAEIDYQLVTAEGALDEASTGTIYSNQQGGYRIANISPEAERIQLFVSANGYQNVMIEEVLELGEAGAQLDLSLGTDS